mgnify:CR=1 FL=1
MSQGIFSALDYLENQIEKVDPKSDEFSGFVAVRRGNGRTLELNDRAHQNRCFELVLSSFPTDDGQAGLSGRKRARINCRVRYEIPADYGFLSRMIGEDTSALINALKAPEYDLVSTGIISVITIQPTFESITNISGEQVAHILTIPFDLLFLEA